MGKLWTLFVHCPNDVPVWFVNCDLCIPIHNWNSIFFLLQHSLKYWIRKFTLNVFGRSFCGIVMKNCDKFHSFMNWFASNCPWHFKYLAIESHQGADPIHALNERWMTFYCWLELDAIEREFYKENSLMSPLKRFIDTSRLSLSLYKEREKERNIH